MESKQENEKSVGTSVVDVVDVRCKLCERQWSEQVKVTVDKLYACYACPTCNNSTHLEFRTPPMLIDGTPCDISDCTREANVILSTDTCDYCADWFIGHYCYQCYTEVVKCMKHLVDKESELKKGCNADQSKG